MALVRYRTGPSAHAPSVARRNRLGHHVERKARARNWDHVLDGLTAAGRRSPLVAAPLAEQRRRRERREKALRAKRAATMRAQPGEPAQQQEASRVTLHAGDVSALHRATSLLVEDVDQSPLAPNELGSLEVESVDGDMAEY